MSDRDQGIIASLHRTYAAFSRGDFDAAMEMAHPEIEFVSPREQSRLRGADALRAWMEPDAFEEQQIEPREIRIQGNKVLVRQHTRARGAGSGIELDVDMWAVWTVDDDGLVTRIESSSSIRKPKPSKPPGCRSRRCRRRTWSSCARSTRRGSAATSARPSGRTPRSSS